MSADTAHPRLPRSTSDAIPGLPEWVDAALTGVVPAHAMSREGWLIESRTTSDLSLLSVCVAGATALSPAAFEAATSAAYALIASRLAALPASHPVRFWNFIPDIHQRQADTAAEGSSLDRYMVFNAGRHKACRAWLGGEDAFPRLLATASGVGHDGEDLVIHALATASTGSAVENPRQIPAYKYSRRYGPHPPCFARATVVELGGRRSILVGGTASVRGEESVYVGDVRKQTAETLDNLAALLQAATGDESAGPHLMTSVRVYHVSAHDVPVLRNLATLAFPSARLEFVRADICRQDLLVEIEGVA